MSPTDGEDVSGGRVGADRGLSRRQVLTALGTGGLTALGGCTTSLGFGEPRSLDPPEVIQDSPTVRVWEFPRGASDDTIVQTYFDQAFRVPSGERAADARFRFGATVFEHSGYHHDQFTVRLRAPAHPTAGRPPAMILVEPAGTWATFRVYREDGKTVVTLRALETAGTIEFDFLVDPRAASTPEALGYDFEVTAAKRGPLGGTAVASDTGQLPVVREDETRSVNRP